MTDRCTAHGPRLWAGRLYGSIVYYGGLLLFAVMCLSWSLLASVLVLVLPESLHIRLGRNIIAFGFRRYLGVLTLSGLVEFDLDALKSLKDERSLIIAPNHPSLIDAVLIVSQLPHAVCIIKASLWDQLILGGSVRLAGYIRNLSQAKLIHDAAEELGNGSQLLVFPEGTRTTGDTLQPFKGGFALIAKRACVPVQTIFIDINQPFLGKQRPLLRKPEFPLIIRVRLGERFLPPEDVKPYVARLESYCRERVISSSHRSKSRADIL